MVEIVAVDVYNTHVRGLPLCYTYNNIRIRRKYRFMEQKRYIEAVEQKRAQIARRCVRLYWVFPRMGLA